MMYIDPTGHYTDYSQIDYAKEAARMNVSQTGAWKDVVDQRLADIGRDYMGGITDLHVVTQILQTVEQPKAASDINSTATNTVAPSPTVPPAANNTQTKNTSSKTTPVAPPVVTPIPDIRTASQIASSVTSDYFNEYGTAGYSQGTENAPVWATDALDRGWGPITKAEYDRRISYLSCSTDSHGTENTNSRSNYLISSGKQILFGNYT